MHLRLKPLGAIWDDQGPVTTSSDLGGTTFDLERLGGWNELIRHGTKWYDLGRLGATTWDNLA